MYSDSGSQLVAANKELKTAIKDLNWSQIRDYGACEGVEWHFTPGDSPWKNGCADVRILLMKDPLVVILVIQMTANTFLQMICYWVDLHLPFLLVLSGKPPIQKGAMNLCSRLLIVTGENWFETIFLPL